MKFIKTKLSGVMIIEPRIFEDDRGYFFESYSEIEFAKHGVKARFVQDNQSSSAYGVIRGLHSQSGAHSQAKLIRVLEGKILDVAVDIRKSSKTFGQYTAVELSAENKRQLFIPRDFLHGFSVLSKNAVIAYKCDNLYSKESELTVCYDDPDIGVDWQIPKDKVIVSDKDRAAKRFRDVIDHR